MAEGLSQMNSSSARREAWLRVFSHEMSRRKRIADEKPKAYIKLFKHNPKRLKECCEGEHIWVPASTLWIHDGAKGSYKIDGILRRGLTEALPYINQDGFRVIPEMCWYCLCTRERIVEVINWTQRQRALADQIALESKGKPRGKRGEDIMIENFDELFEF